MQYAYNRHNNFNWFRDSVALNLGYWHPYKCANEKLFRYLLPTFFGPAYHALFPAFSVLKKPRLTHLVSFFNFLSCAYPLIRNDLLRLCTSVRVGHPHFSDIWNLVDIFEVYLPIVSSLSPCIDISLCICSYILFNISFVCFATFACIVLNFVLLQ